jgi:uncharacterized membrane protein YhhN
MNLWIVVCAAVLLAGLLYCEKKEILKAKLAVKTALSALFILTAVVQPHPMGSYYRFILVGLIFCLGGDVFLALPPEKMFRWGLVSFLSGHVFYVVAFLYVAGINSWTFIGLSISVIISGGVYIWLRPYLESMKIPVLCYIIVITAMVVGAWTVLASGELAIAGRVLVFIGALGFYFSDIFVARQRFLKAEFFNRLMGLPLYYGGQFMLAFSVGWLAPIRGVGG